MAHQQETFVDLETQVWSALVAGDAAADQSLLSEGFLGVYSTGFADRGEHAGQLVDGPTIASFTIEDARLHSISPDAALFSYLATFVRVGPDAPIEQMYVSSLWEWSDGSWLNTFSQDTLAS